VLALEPGNLEALSRLSLEKRHLFDWAEFDADLQTFETILQALPAGRALMAATFSLLSLPLSPALHLKAAAADALAICGSVRPLPAVVPAQRTAARIRLGLVSFDFRDHPVSQLLLPVLEQIDRQRFELLLYSSGPNDGSALRERAVRAADQFIELHGLSDAQAADRIRADGVDLLVDLMGHTRGARAAIFARKPAPVQAAYLGFPASTGMLAMDYIVGDPLVTPLALAANYSEKLALLPLTLQPNGAERPLPQPMTRAQAGLPEDAFVMCAFNHTYKIGPAAFDTWCSLLRDLPNAVLWLKETNPQFHTQVRHAAVQRGVAAQRIVFAPIVPYADHFSRLALADIFVDTWPYNAHTTASDALWAGVPVVTHYGESYASRVAASVLNAVGLAELAFDTVADYRCAIQALALEPALLATYRQHLVTQRHALPLFDARRYARELEALFARMVQRWRAGLPVDHLTPAPPETQA
jgi:predicted O-linked N-acetylglucosamine transferase (SPINDLY family)